MAEYTIMAEYTDIENFKNLEVVMAEMYRFRGEETQILRNFRKFLNSFRNFEKSFEEKREIAKKKTAKNRILKISGNFAVD